MGSILDPDDPQCCADEKANITYLAEVMKAMPAREGEWGSEEDLPHRREGLMYMELDTEEASYILCLPFGIWGGGGIYIFRQYTTNL